MSGPRLAADVVCGGEPVDAVFSRGGADASSSAPAALGEGALARQDAVLPVAAVAPIAPIAPIPDHASRLVAGGRVASAAGVPSTGSDRIGATKIKSAVEAGALAALHKADESESMPGDAAASYTVRQGDTCRKSPRSITATAASTWPSWTRTGRRSLTRTRSIPAWWCASRRWAEATDVARGRRATAPARAQPQPRPRPPAEFCARDRRCRSTGSAPTLARDHASLMSRERDPDYRSRPPTPLSCGPTLGWMSFFRTGGRSRERGSERTPVAGGELADARGFRRR
jgi:hypothetical protein